MATDTAQQSDIRYWQEAYTAGACGDRVIIAHDDSTVRVLLVDACGHGAEAAVVAQVFERIARPDLGSPLTSATFRHWNDQLAEHTADITFIALTAIEMNNETGCLRIWNAGNPAPICLRQETTRLEESKVFAQPLGLFESPLYTPPVPIDIRLQPGDTLLAFSDGLTDQRREDDFFGDGRVRDTLNRTMGHDTDALDSLRLAMSDFLGDEGLADDLTTVQITWANNEVRAPQTVQRQAA